MLYSVEFYNCCGPGSSCKEGVNVCACVSLIVILGGTAGQGQPLDISVKNYKDYLRKKYECRVGVSSLKEKVGDNLKKCCITNALDGIEVDIA